MPELFARPVHGTQDEDPQLLLAAWHHHRHQSDEPLRKALSSTWDWGWANGNILDKFQELQGNAGFGKHDPEAADADMAPFGDLQPQGTSRECMGNVMRARPLKQQSRRTAQARCSSAPNDAAGDALALDLRSKPIDQFMFEDAALKLLAGVVPTDTGTTAVPGTGESLAAGFLEDGVRGSPGTHKAKPGVCAGRLKAGKGALARLGRQKRPQNVDGSPTSGGVFGKAGCEVLFGLNLQARIDGRYT